MPKTSTVASQKRVLRDLSQQAAAYLVGLSPRALRDSDAPRTDSGNYDGQKLARWAAGTCKKRKEPPQGRLFLGLLSRGLLCLAATVPDYTADTE